MSPGVRECFFFRMFVITETRGGEHPVSVLVESLIAASLL
jgi:hypothetical protein